MSPRVKLSDIIYSIGFQSYDTAFYLNRENGELIPVSREQLRAAEEDGDRGDSPEWEKARINLVREILADKKEEKYVAIPGMFVNHEHSVMENFCLSLNEAEIAKPLCSLILGKSARRRFNNSVHHFGVAEEWHAYRYKGMKRVVTDWCKANNIDYLEE